MDQFKNSDECYLRTVMLLGSFREIIKKANELESLFMSDKVPKDYFEIISGQITITKIKGKFSGIIESYNRGLEELKKLSNCTYEILSEIKQIDLNRIDKSNIEFYIPYHIQIIINNSEAIISALENLQKEKYGNHFEETSKLEAEIQEFEFSNKLIYNHLKDSIKSLNNGTYIGAVLTAGKVASFILENIELDDEGRSAIDSFKKLNPNDKIGRTIKEDDEKVRILVEKGLIRKDERDNFIRGIRRLRNAYTHNLEYIPEGYNEASSFVTSAISLAKIYSKLQNDKTPNNTNTG